MHSQKFPVRTTAQGKGMEKGLPVRTSLIDPWRQDIILCGGSFLILMMWAAWVLFPGERDRTVELRSGALTSRGEAATHSNVNLFLTFFLS